MTLEISHLRQTLGSIRLHVAECGDGPPVLVLHGFPELWWGFRGLMLALGAAGYRAIAPDLRGYGASDKPTRLEAYRFTTLVDDLAQLVRTRASGQAHVVAHDWGGVLAYGLASRYPKLVSKLVIMNAPHPERLRQTLLSSTQVLRSWYIFGAQLPWLPELVLRSRWLARAVFFGSAARPDVFSEQDVDAYHAALNVPHAATSMLNYYRATFHWPLSAPDPIEAPTLVIWGERDGTLDRRLLDGLEHFVTDLRVARVGAAGHFVHHDEPKLVRELVLAHLRRAR